MSQITYGYQDQKGDDLEIDVTYIAVCNPSYGADADGNRGIECWELSDFIVEIYSENVNVTKQFAMARPEEYRDIMSDAADRALDDAASKDPDYYEMDDDS